MKLHTISILYLQRQMSYQRICPAIEYIFYNRINKSTSEEG